MSYQGKISVLELEGLVNAAYKNDLQYVKVLSSGNSSTINLVVDDGNDFYGRSAMINLVEEK